MIIASNGDPKLATDDARVEGDWAPLDTRDGASVHIVSDATAVDHTLTVRSIATQKTVQATPFINVGPAGFSPGDTVKYTINVQVSDFFAFSDLVVTDTLADGLRFDPTQPATLQVNGNGFIRPDTVLTKTGAVTATLHSDNNLNTPASDGSTTIVFDVSGELAFAGQGGGKLIGIDAGYASTTARLVNGGKVDVDGGQFGIFASYFDMGFYVDASVHGGVAGYKTRRTGLGGVATASPDGTSFSALLAAGYDWKIGGLTVGPTASFQYTNTRLDGFTETGSLAPLAVAGHNAESSRSTVGIRAFYDATVGGVTVRPEVRVAWQHEYSDTSHALTSNFATLGGNAFTVNGPSIGRDSLLVGAGVTVVWNSLLSTFLAYDGELARTNYESHSISGGVRVAF